MDKKKVNSKENEILSAKELCVETKKTLKSYIKANTFIGFAAGLAAGTTLIGVATAEDTEKKIILGCSGAILTAISAKMIAESFNRMDGFIDNHDDTVKLQIVDQFLNAKGEEAKEEFIDNMIDELHTKVNT